VADEKEQQQPEAATAGESRETEVGHPVVEADAPAREGTTEVFFSRPGEGTSSTGAPQPAAAPRTGSGGTSPAAADREAAESHGSFEEKPEMFIAGAFVGAFVFGQLLKRLTGSDD
jgi:hypothetical protein